MQLDPIVIPDSTPESKDRHRAYIEELEEELRETLRLAEEIPDDQFPDFLFKPQKNEFGDSYYQKAMSASKHGAAIAMLRKKYNNFYDYMDALSIYQEYMEDLIDRYGTWQMLKVGVENGVIHENLPTMPRLKNTKRNKALLQSDVMPSRRIAPFADVDEIHEAVGRMKAKMPEEVFDTEYDPEDIKPPKVIRKVLKTAAKKRAEQRRKQSIYNIRRDSETDAMLEFMRAKDGHYYNGRKGGAVRDDSLSATLKDLERYAGYDPEEIELLENEDGPYVMIEGGRYIDAKEKRKIDLFKILFEEGYDVIGKAGKSMSKQENRMLMRELAPHMAGPMSKKKMKKFEKKMKRDAAQSLKAEQQIFSTLAANKFDFDMLGSRNPASFRLSDVFPDDM